MTSNVNDFLQLPSMQAIQSFRLRIMNRVILAFLCCCAFLAADAAAAGGDYAAWTWSKELPTQLSTGSARANRTSEAVDKFFRQTPISEPSIQRILDFSGMPEAFSPQFMYSRTQGSAKPGKEGGTLRFLLDDGGEFHVFTSNYHGVGLALRHRKKGDSVLLYK